MVLTRLRQFFVKNSSVTGRIVAAVSGGADSTALLLALAELRDEGLEVVAAHINHHLRGEESDADEAFVRDLCATLRIDLHVVDGTLDPRAVRDRGVEAAAREIRYARLHDVRERTGARYIATAHQKNDQAETVLMRLLTGSGIAGLRGIHPVRDDGCIRPLLEVSRAEIEAFLRERNVAPRHDRSNDDPRFLRNRVRAVLRELGGIDHLASAAAQASAIWPLLEEAIDDAERGCTELLENETRFTSLPEDDWLRAALLQRHIRRLDPAARDYDIRRIAEEARVARRTRITKTLELVRDGNVIIIRAWKPGSRDARVAIELPLTLDAPTFVPELNLTVHLHRNAAEGSAVPHDATRNAQLVQLPNGAPPDFTVRTRRAGDRFQPLGMLSSKNLKDFLIDRKIAAGLRDRLPLVVWNEQIVWIAGVEVAETVKVTSPAAGDLYELWIE